MYILFTSFTIYLFTVVHMFHQVIYVKDTEDTLY